jgi:hypothetical protein
VKRQADQQREWWDQARTEVVARLARIDRGDSWAPAQVVRCLRVFVAPELRR